MITRYGDVFVATLKSERQKLIKDGQIVYSQEEFEIANAVPQVAELAPYINQLKLAFPDVELISVRLNA